VPISIDRLTAVHELLACHAYQALWQQTFLIMLPDLTPLIVPLLNREVFAMPAEEKDSH